MPFLCQHPSQDPTFSRFVSRKIHEAVVCRVDGRGLCLKAGDPRGSWGGSLAGEVQGRNSRCCKREGRRGDVDLDSVGLLDRHLLMHRSDKVQSKCSRALRAPPCYPGGYAAGNHGAPARWRALVFSGHTAVFPPASLPHLQASPVSSLCTAPTHGHCL